MESPPVRLTQTVQKGGCAAKVAARELRKILSQLQLPPHPPELIVGTGTFDDAAVYQVGPELALVQTLDFFTPIVDTPRLFGKIAAANSLSDVYAMGGKPKTALGILAFPLMTMESSVITEVLQGACDVIAESGAALVGGHTIDDDTLKFGLSVTGFVHPQQVWTNAGARPGDALLLTKALGTGTLTAALKRSEIDENGIREALDSMCQLNDLVELIPAGMRSAIHAATDVTGFGLAGHAWNMAKASGIELVMESSRLPRFEQALSFLEKGFLTKAHRTNKEYVQDHCRFGKVDSFHQLLAFDPQTSGGLLLAVDSSAANEVRDLALRRFPHTEIIGHVAAGPAGLQFL
jgi:selenide, water dikinase